MLTYEDRDKNILSHILEYCEQIEKCFLKFGNSHEDFLSDVVFRNALSMPVFQIQELSIHLSDEFKEKTKNEIPWKELRGMRNLFAHNYLEMDIEIIWEAATEDVPHLKEFCETQLKLFDEAD